MAGFRKQGRTKQTAIYYDPCSGAPTKGPLGFGTQVGKSCVMVGAEYALLVGLEPYHRSHSSLGKGNRGNPIRPIRDYSELSGLIIRAYWVALAPLP